MSAIRNSLVQIESSGTEQGFPRVSLYTYIELDADIGQITAVDYFSNVIRYELEVNDIILATLSDGIHTLSMSDSGTAELASFKTQRFTTGGTIKSATDLVISTGTHTLVMPDSHAGILEIKSISGTATLDPGTNTFESGNTVTATVNRRLFLDVTVWIEL